MEAQSLLRGQSEEELVSLEKLGKLKSSQKMSVTLQEKEILEMIGSINQIETQIQQLKERLRGDEVHLHHMNKKKLIPAWLQHNLLLITFLWQVASLVLILILSQTHSRALAVDFSLSIAIAFQVGNLILNIILSVKLTKQLFHRTASGWFLVQSYGSTILLFGGIYALIYRLDEASFTGLPALSSNTDALVYIEVFIRFNYFSIVTMTTAGFGDIHAVSIVSVLVVSVQLLLSVVYTTVIFVKGLAHFGASQSNRTINH